ncbi:MAG: FecR domain-containing protein [Cyclobacteriaceae bacterium]
MSIENIISKECQGKNLDPGEKKQLNLWLNENPKNHQLYAQLKLSLLYPDNGEMDTMETKVWTDLQSRLNRNGSQEKKSTNISWIYRVAAIVLLGLIGSFIAIEFSSDSNKGIQLVEVKMIEKVSVSGQKITTILPDGTKVKLNSESKLIVPEQFELDRREVELQGEAFFEVVENRNAPFIVKSGDMEVKVLGTSFNVSAYQDDKLLKVGVKTGKVEVKGIGETKEYTVTLLPNDMSTWDPEQNQLEKNEIGNTDAIFGWTDQKLVFENHSLPAVLNTLSKWYGVKFIDDKKLAESAKRKYTAKYQNPTLEQMMISVAHVYDFEFEINKTENEITLK